MEFGKHIGKGLWAFADKTLPALYALGFIFLVIRVLPENEYGSFALIQSVFTIVASLGFALALQPLTKFAAETAENGPYIVASLAVNGAFYAIVSLGILLSKRLLAALIDPTGQGNFEHLASYIPLLLLASYYRAFAASLLQASYAIQRIFWIDAVYFVGTFGLIVLAQKLGRFRTAEDMILLNVYGQGLSSIVAAVLTRRPRSVRLKGRREAFLRMWNYGKYSFGAIASYNLYSQADIFFVSAFAGIVATATYSAAKNFTRLFDIMSQVIQMFMLPLSSKLSASGERESLTAAAEKTILFATLMLVPVFILLLGLPELLVDILYAGKYSAAVPFLRFFSFLAFLVPVNATCASIIMGFGRARAGFVISLVLLMSSSALYYVLVQLNGAAGVSIAYVASFGITTLIIVAYTSKLLPFSLIGILGRFRDIRNFVVTNVRRKNLFS